MKKLLTYLTSLIIGSLLPIVSGCGNSQSQSSSNLFAESDSIDWTIINDNEILHIANDIMVSDSVIYVLGLMDGSWLHLYDKNTGKLIGNHILQGQGPNEIINALDISLASDDELAIFDINDQRIKLFSANNFTLTESYDLKSLLRSVWDAYALKDGNYLVKAPSFMENESPVRSFSIVNSKTKQIVSTYTQLPEEFKEEPMLLMVQSDLAISPDGKHFVSVTTRGGTIEIFNIKDNEIQETFSAIPFPIEFTETNGIKQLDANAVLGFISATGDNDFWVASYCGTNKDVDANKIGIWNWNGKPLKGLVTDRMILKLTLDHDSKILYGLLADKDGDFSLGMINLNQLNASF
ncbi:MAG: TolB-like 6-bladed beta-propeller domain-containing protein [Muribaculaceae bacterium]|nr:TolB-like 6-bladed beta-propeller domain-containing protein [Muribaculaceae bacterium]